MGAIDKTRLENAMIDTMWSFLQMGGLKSNYPALKKACMELRQMIMQKTAGQRKNRPQDMSWDNLERVKAYYDVDIAALKDDSLKMRGWYEIRTPDYELGDALEQFYDM